MTACCWPTCPNAEPPLDAPRPLLYVARSGGACVEVGDSLGPFIDGLVRGLDPGDGDLAVWLHEPGGASRLVAAVRPGPRGEADVTWL